MTEDRSSAKAIWVLGAGLGAALLVIAFLLGRESSRVVPVADPARELTQTDSVDEREASEATKRAPVSKGDDPFSWEADPGEAEADARAMGSARIERTPDGKIVLSNVREEGDEIQEPSQPDAAPPPNATALLSTDQYLAQLDAVRSEQDASNPNAFAMNLLRAGMRGSTEGFDQLIEDTERMQKEIRAITPPPRCQLYHAATLDALAESREILENMKVAMKRRDVQGMMAAAQEASALQTKATELQTMERDLRAQ